MVNHGTTVADDADIGRLERLLMNIGRILSVFKKTWH
jgi:hypothetical protein